MELILLRGLAATGKTTLSKLIVTEIKPRITVWEKDEVFDQLLLEGIVWEEANERTYDNLYTTIFENRIQNKDMLVDAPFYRKRDINYFFTFCNQHQITVKSILTICSDEKEWRRRFKLRSIDPRPNQSITDYEEIAEYYGSMKVIPIEDELVYDSCCTMEIEKLKKYLK